MNTVVINMRTGQEQVYNLDPRKAVLAAFAQYMMDWNTWGYYKYEDRIKEGKVFFFCGDFAAKKQNLQ